MVIHPRAHDLVVGTHGRGIWILDSIAGLRGLTPEVVAAGAAIFTPRPALLLTRFDRGRTSLGSAYYTAANPADGAYLDIYVRPGTSDAVAIEIFDPAGRRLRRLDVQKASGLTRVVWDLRADPPPDAPAAGRGRGGPARPLVAPGTYEARLTIGSRTFTTPVRVLPDPGR
jgi:hypothetical protein